MLNQEKNEQVTEKKRYKAINFEQIESAKKGLSVLEVEKSYTVGKAVYELRTEINKLVRKGVKISQIIEELKKHNISANYREIKEILGEIPTKKEKVTQKINKITNDKEVKETKKEEKKENIKKIVNKKVETVVTLAKEQEQKPLFKVPDLSTLPPELTSIPGFNPASPEIVRFVDAKGCKKIYMKGRCVSDPSQGPMHSIDLDKHR